MPPSIDVHNQNDFLYVFTQTNVLKNSLNSSSFQQKKLFVYS